tara:strand:+ start:598 stop:1128 length:531 start_codon:yes stop_codon:yes gene_type:complete
MSEEVTTTETEQATPTGVPSVMVAEAPTTVSAAADQSLPIEEPSARPEQDTEIDKVVASDGGDSGADLAELQAQIEALKSAQDASNLQLKKHTSAMRETLLAKLGVMEKFRGYAPDVDPFSDDGRSKLEAWARENTELLESRPSSAPDVDVEALKSKIRSPHLVDLNSFVKSMKGV